METALFMIDDACVCQSTSIDGGECPGCLIAIERALAAEAIFHDWARNCSFWQPDRHPLGIDSRARNRQALLNVQHLEKGEIRASVHHEAWLKIWHNAMIHHGRRSIGCF